MPVTVKPSSHPSESWAGSGYRRVSSPELLLNYTLRDDDVRKNGPPRELVQSSFADFQKDDMMFATKNGFVHASMEAYNQHHCLVVRPEDVWFAILTQFSVYVNAHSEDLRHLFVEHKGKESLEIIVETLGGIDHGKMAFEMTKLMQGKIKDQELQHWILPAFTTTTKVDQAVASIIFMGTMQKYFTYSWGTRCGLPAVTLLGEVGDWVKIRQRAEKLSAFGEEPQRWLRALRPVLDGFVSTFREPESHSVRRFWQGICNEHQPNGSGTVTYSGWITAFCFWDEQGKCLHSKRPDGQVRLTRGDIPAGFTKVPVTLLDNGLPIPTEMIAGSMALKVSWSQGRTNEDTAEPRRAGSPKWLGNDQIQPEVGWFMYKT